VLARFLVTNREKARDTAPEKRVPPPMSIAAPIRAATVRKRGTLPREACAAHLSNPYPPLQSQPISADMISGDAFMNASAARPQAPWALRLLPPFPAIAHRILALASQEDVGAHELGSLIKLDPSFSAELLRFANSALFGAQREITSLTQAVARLGMERVRSMATFVALNNMVRTSVRAPALRKVWVHSVVTAIIAEEAARVARLDCEVAYTTALLHNLGTLGLMSAYPDEYSRMLEISNDFGFDLLQTERDLFEIDHCAAGAYLALDWQFPDQLAAAIATHHDEPVPNMRSLDNLIKVSWRLTDTLGYAAFSPAKEWTYEELANYLPHAPHSWLCQSAESAKSGLDARISTSPL
jgi:putative nucleotidyltransferase with HDIG domain